MADVAGTVLSFLNYATQCYKNIQARQSAQAVMKGGIGNWIHYQRYMIATTDEIFISPFRYHAQIIYQAVWVMEQDDTIRQWLDDAGFKNEPVKSYSKVISYHPSRKARAPRKQGYIERKDASQLKFPFFGVTEKAKDFDQMFERLRQAFERLQEMMYSGSYPTPTDKDWTAIIGRPDRPPNKPPNAPTPVDGGAAERAAERERLNIKLALAGLYGRLERGISTMLLSMGKVKEESDRRIEVTRIQRRDQDRLRRETEMVESKRERTVLQQEAEDQTRADELRSQGIGAHPQRRNGPPPPAFFDIYMDRQMPQSEDILHFETAPRSSQPRNVRNLGVFHADKSQDPQPRRPPNDIYMDTTTYFRRNDGNIYRARRRPPEGPSLSFFDPSTPQLRRKNGHITFTNRRLSPGQSSSSNSSN